MLAAINWGHAGLLGACLALGVAGSVGWWRMSPKRARVFDPWSSLPNRSLGAGLVVWNSAALGFLVMAVGELGWIRTRVTAPVSGVLFIVAAVGFLAIATTWIAWRPRWLLPPKLRRELARRGSPPPPPPDRSAPGHRVTVMHVDPPPDDPHFGEYEPYYVALCESEDLGPEPRSTADEAFTDARAHSADVDPQIVRPLDP